MNKKIFSIIGKMFLILIASIIIGAICLFAVYSIPTGRMVNNIENSNSLFVDGEDRIRNWVGDLRYGKIDYATDRTMIGTAICREFDSNIDNALLNPNWTYDENKTFEFVTEKENSLGYTTYGRYWHGYLLYLIPGLNFFSYGGLRVVMMTVQFMLIFYLLLLIYERKKKYFLPYIATILFINPVTTILNLQNADVLIISLISSIICIRFRDKLIIKNNYLYLFMLIGIITVYFDFLTYPLVTWGMTIITLLLFSNLNLKESIKITILSGLSWIFGYGGMWAGKWILASLLTDTNIIADAINNVLFRSGVSDTVSENLGFDFAIENAISSFKDPQTVAMGLLFVMMIVANAIINKNKLNISKQYLINSITFLIIWLSPYVWAFVVRNHFVTHQFLEYRTLAIAVLVKYLLISNLFIERKDCESGN